jgi:8-oxo-dGTP pyrophosphatase MutT (NUDIX family)
MSHGIDVTVAAIIEQDARFLVVEERTSLGKLVLNQPAGHLEQGESLVNAVIRETLEETGHRFAPSDVVGFYLWRSEEASTTYFRVAFCGTAEAPNGIPTLDEGIVGVHWLSRAQLLNREFQLRSPMVMSGFDDYLAGRRYPLDCLNYLDPFSLALGKIAGT